MTTKRRIPKGIPIPAPSAMLWLLEVCNAPVDVELGLLVGEVVVLVSVGEVKLGLAALDIDEAAASVEEELAKVEEVEVVDEADAEAVEMADITVIVEYGYESRLVVALVEQQSCPCPVVPSTPAQHQLLESPR